MNRFHSVMLASGVRIVAALCIALGLTSCGDSPVSARSSEMQLVISLGSQVTTSRRVDVVVSYQLTGGGFTTLTSSLNLTVATGTQQLPIAVDLSACLANPNHAGGAGICRLAVAVTLKDGSNGSVLDAVVLGPFDAAPGSSPAPQTVTVAAVNTITISGLATTPYFVGQTAQAVATVRDASGNTLTRPVTWSSTAALVAPVNATTGLVTFTTTGTAQIVASSGGITQQSSTVTVIAPVSTVTVAPTSAGIFVGEAVQLVPTLRDALGNVLTGRVVTYSSSSGVATVSASGLVTGVSAGTATITVTSEGRTATVAITVSVVPPPPPLILVSLSPTSMSGNHTVGSTSCPQILGNVTVTNTHTAAVTWLAGSDHSALSVSGVVTPGGTLAPGASSSFSVRFTCSQTQSFTGTVTVTATSGGVTQSRSVSVTMTIGP